MQKVDKIAPRPKKTKIKKSPLGMALNLPSNSTGPRVPPKIQNLNFNTNEILPPSNTDMVRIDSMSHTINNMHSFNTINSMNSINSMDIPPPPSHPSSKPRHGAHPHSISIQRAPSLQQSFGTGPPALSLDNPEPLSSYEPMSNLSSMQPSHNTALSLTNIQLDVGNAHNDEEIIGDDDDEIHAGHGYNGQNVMTPQGNNRSIQTPFGDDIIIENGNDEDENENGDKSPFNIIDTGENGEFHIDLIEDEDVENVNEDTGESDDYDDDDDILIEDGGITIGMIDDENDNGQNDVELFGGIDTAE